MPTQFIERMAIECERCGRAADTGPRIEKPAECEDLLKRFYAQRM